MAAGIESLGHASFRLSAGGQVVYIDPYEIEGDPRDGTAVLCTHDHRDHCSPDDIGKVAGAGCVILAPESCRAKVEALLQFVAVAPEGEYDAGGVPVKTVPAYNIDKAFHPRSAGGVGYLVTIGGETVYHAGDTDVIPEMDGLAPDVALLPVGGKYTMDAEEAARAFRKTGAKRAIPMHFGAVAGSKADAERFIKLTRNGLA